MGRLRNGVGIGISNIPTLSSRRPFSPLSLFADGSQGVWYDDSNTDSMFQDSAGTIPAALESPVGKQLDLSGNNNHRTQATSAKRPTLSARYNGLQKTENWSTSPWTFTSFPAAITPNAGTDPLGGNKASQVVFSAQYQNVGQNYSTVIGVSYTYRFWAKVISGNTSLSGVISGLTGNAPFTATSDWTVISLPFVATASTVQVGVQDRNASGFGTLQVFGADIRPTNQATGLIPTYQRVDTSSSYDTVGFPQYLKYNGSSSSLSTASINFTATAQVTAFAGVRKLSDSANGFFTELSASSLLNTGTFYITAPNSAAANYGFGSKGLLLASPVSASSYAAPITNTLNMAANISAPSLNANINNVSAVTDTSLQGTGNYGNYALYFGARAGTSLYFNGQEYQTIIVGKTLTATQITATETYVNSKTKAY